MIEKDDYFFSKVEFSISSVLLLVGITEKLYLIEGKLACCLKGDSRKVLD